VGAIKPTLDWDKSEIGTGLADFCICIEMAAAAVAHRYYFSSRDFWRGEGDVTAPLRDAIAPGARPGNVSVGLVAMLPHDVILDAVAHAQTAHTAVAGALASAVGRGRKASNTDDNGAGSQPSPTAAALAAVLLVAPCAAPVAAAAPPSRCAGFIARNAAPRRRSSVTRTYHCSLRYGSTGT
jgi:hypothetical protein